MVNSKYLYEKYHQKTNAIKQLISENNFTYSSIIKVLKPYAPNKIEILDIGCGSGTLSLYLASKGNKVKGIDVSKKAIKSCKQSAKNLGLTQNTNFIIGDFLKINIKEKFDLIICNEVLEHIKKDDSAISKIAKLLKNNGILILSVPSIEAPLYRLGLAKKFDKRVGHLRRYTFGKINKLIEKKKLKIINMQKTEGIIRNFIFSFKINIPIIKLANRTKIASKIIAIIDKISLQIFGASQIIIVAQKKP